MTNSFRYTRMAILATLVVACLLLLLAAQPAHAAPTTFTVNSAGDAGDGVCDASECTLREAIDDADANDNPQETDLIEFDIPGPGPHTIRPNSNLDIIQDPVIIDGYTEAGASPNTLAKGTNAKIMIALDGSNTGLSGYGLVTDGTGAGGVVIRGFAINRFGGPGISIGGTGAQSNVKIEGNFIGTDLSGTIDLGNGEYGVEIIYGSGVTVGGSTPAARNLISGNQNDGVFMYDNHSDADSPGNKVLGNLIGTEKDGTSPLGNGGSGVTLLGTHDNQIGGERAASANTVAFNAQDGVVVSDHPPLNRFSPANRILRNSIFSNAGLGIDLLGQNEDFTTDVPTANDVPGDTDSGPNELQNKPVLSSAKTVSGKTTVRGKLESKPSEAFVIRFFSNPQDTNEGKTYLGKTSVTTTVDGIGSFSFSPKKALVAGANVTATATDSGGNTSEFSAPRTVVAQ